MCGYTMHEASRPTVLKPVHLILSPKLLYVFLSDAWPYIRPSVFTFQASSEIFLSTMKNERFSESFPTGSQTHDR